MTLKKTTTALALVAAVSSLQGCTRDISSTTYTEASVGEASTTYKGQIISARVVTVKASERLEGNTTGIAAGGLAGAVAGSNIGKGGAANLAGAVGAGLVGATFGALAEQKLKTQKAAEYVVELSDGRIKTIVQALEPAQTNPQRVIAPGTRVLLTESRTGRGRVVPFGG